MDRFVSGQLLRIFVGERAAWQGRPLHEAIVELLRRHRVAGASVFRGIEGFGSHHELHRARIFHLDDVPILIEVVDTEETIAQLVPRIDEMVGVGTLTLERVEFRRYLPSNDQRREP